MIDELGAEPPRRRRPVAVLNAAEEEAGLGAEEVLDEMYIDRAFDQLVANSLKARSGPQAQPGGRRPGQGRNVGQGASQAGQGDPSA